MSLIKFWRFTGVGRPLQEEGNIVEDVQLSGRWNVISIYQLKKLLKLMACYMLHAVASWRPILLACYMQTDRDLLNSLLLLKINLTCNQQTPSARLKVRAGSRHMS